MPTIVSTKPVRQKQRTVYPPSRGFGMSAGALLSVTLEEDEDVVWHWTHHQDGRSAVTGYTIVPKLVTSLLDRLPVRPS